MLVHGCDCSIVIKTAYREMGIPYAEETIREAISILQEQAAIEGDGGCKAIAICGGVTGCVVTPLTIGSAPLLLYLAFGGCGLPLLMSSIQTVYQYHLNLLPFENSGRFDLVQYRGTEKRLFEGCRVRGFELRFEREKAIHLKLDIRNSGNREQVIGARKGNREQGTGNRLEEDVVKYEKGERFSGDGVSYRINGTEYKNIYGLTLTAKKKGGTKTELWINRVLQAGPDLPSAIEELVITAQLLRDTYGNRCYGTFRITLKRLVLVSDETYINAADTVIGPIRYYVAGSTDAEVFTASGESLDIAGNR